VVLDVLVSGDDLGMRVLGLGEELVAEYVVDG